MTRELNRIGGMEARGRHDHGTAHDTAHSAAQP
jgi:hypothetical protein